MTAANIEQARTLLLSLPEKERMERWLLEKHEELTSDHRAESLADEIDPQLLEDLKALGYI